jgi:hypothetical protein
MGPDLMPLTIALNTGAWVQIVIHRVCSQTHALTATPANHHVM